jgi:hypothetical protein
MNKAVSTDASPPRFNWYTGASLNSHSFESDWTVVGTPVVTVPPFSDSKTDIRSFAGITFQPPKGNFSFGLEAGMIGRDLKDTQLDTSGLLLRMIIHDEKSLVVNVSKSSTANNKIILTGFAGYSELDVTARGWNDRNGNGEPSPGENSDNPGNTTRFKSLPGFTLGAGLSFLPSDNFTIRLEQDKTWYKAKTFILDDYPTYTEKIKPRTENMAIGLTYKW